MNREEEGSDVKADEQRRKGRNGRKVRKGRIIGAKRQPEGARNGPCGGAAGVSGIQRHVWPDVLNENLRMEK